MVDDTITLTRTLSDSQQMITVTEALRYVYGISEEGIAELHQRFVFEGKHPLKEIETAFWLLLGDLPIPKEWITRIPTKEWQFCSSPNCQFYDAFTIGSENTCCGRKMV